MSAERDALVCLATARRRATVKADRARVAAVVQARLDSVQLILGSDDDGIDIDLSPDVWEMLAQEILQACKDSRAAKARAEEHQKRVREARHRG